MGWADDQIRRIARDGEATFKVFGHSMQGRITSGSTVTVRRIADDQALDIHDVVLVTVKGKQYLHLITGIRKHEGSDVFTIGNNNGLINGDVGRRSIHGVCVRVIPP
jgi:ketopantoate reductase